MVFVGVVVVCLVVFLVLSLHGLSLEFGQFLNADTACCVKFEASGRAYHKISSGLKVRVHMDSCTSIIE